MTAIRAWLVTFFGTALVVSLLEALFPKGVYRNMGKFLGGVLLLLLFLSSFSRVELSDVAGRISEGLQGIRQQSPDYSTLVLEEQTRSIEDKTAAYIEKTAREMGLECSAEISCAVKDGVPFPDRVSLSIPYHATLSETIRQELAIAPENQYWTERDP